MSITLVAKDGVVIAERPENPTPSTSVQCADGLAHTASHPTSGAPAQLAERLDKEAASCIGPMLASLLRSGAVAPSAEEAVRAALEFAFASGAASGYEAAIARTRA